MDGSGSFWSGYLALDVQRESEWTETLSDFVFEISSKTEEEIELKLQSVLDQEECIQEIKANCASLIQFLAEPLVLSFLIRYITLDPPSDSSQNRGFTYPYIANEVICCASDEIIRSLLSSKEENRKILDEFWDFLDREPPLNYVLAGYFSRSAIAIYNKMPHHLCEYLRTRENLFNRFLVHLSSRSLTELFKILLCADSPSKNVFISERTMISILNQLSDTSNAHSLLFASFPHESSEEKEELNETKLKDDEYTFDERYDNVTLILREIFFRQNEVYWYPVYIEQLTSEECISFLIKCLLSNNAGSRSAAISVLCDLLHVTCAAANSRSISSSSNNNREAENDIEYLGPTGAAGNLYYNCNRFNNNVFCNNVNLYNSPYESSRKDEMLDNNNNSNFEFDLSNNSLSAFTKNADEEIDVKTLGVWDEDEKEKKEFEDSNAVSNTNDEEKGKIAAIDNDRDVDMLNDKSKCKEFVNNKAEMDFCGAFFEDKRREEKQNCKSSVLDSLAGFSFSSTSLDEDLNAYLDSKKMNVNNDKKFSIDDGKVNLSSQENDGIIFAYFDEKTERELSEQLKEADEKQKQKLLLAKDAKSKKKEKHKKGRRVREEGEEAAAKDAQEKERKTSAYKLSSKPKDDKELRGFNLIAEKQENKKKMKKKKNLKTDATNNDSSSDNNMIHDINKNNIEKDSNENNNNERLLSFSPSSCLSLNREEKEKSIEEEKEKNSSFKDVFYVKKELQNPDKSFFVDLYICPHLPKIKEMLLCSVDEAAANSFEKSFSSAATKKEEIKQKKKKVYRITRVGLLTLEILQLIKALFKTDSQKAANGILECGFIDLTVQLFFAHKWNTLLHISLCDIIYTAVQKASECPALLSHILHSTSFTRKTLKFFKAAQKCRHMNELTMKCSPPLNECHSSFSYSSSSIDVSENYNKNYMISCPVYKNNCNINSRNTIRDDNNTSSLKTPYHCKRQHRNLSVVEQVGYTSHLIHICQIINNKAESTPWLRESLASLNGWHDIIVPELKYHFQITQQPLWKLPDSFNQNV